jgi:hypothetical protein
VLDFRILFWCISKVSLIAPSATAQDVPHLDAAAVIPVKTHSLLTAAFFGLLRRLTTAIRSTRNKDKAQ